MTSQDSEQPITIPYIKTTPVLVAIQGNLVRHLGEPDGRYGDMGRGEAAPTSTPSQAEALLTG